MADRDYKAFIVEGEAREPLIIDNISKVFFSHGNFKIITLGQRIRTARIRMGMTQEELAEEMNTTKSMISYYENDHGDMKQSMIAEFAKILGTTVEYLVCGVIKESRPDASSAEMLQLFSSMDEQTKEIMLIQMRALAKRGH